MADQMSAQQAREIIDKWHTKGFDGDQDLAKQDITRLGNEVIRRDGGDSYTGEE